MEIRYNFRSCNTSYRYCNQDTFPLCSSLILLNPSSPLDINNLLPPLQLRPAYASTAVLHSVSSSSSRRATCVVPLTLLTPPINHSQSPHLLSACHHHERTDSASPLSSYHRCPRRPTHNWRRCPNMRRLSRPLHHRCCIPHDHTPNQRKKRTPFPHFRHAVRLLHVKDRYHHNAHRMGQLPPQWENSHCGQHLCRRWSGPTLCHQPPLCPTPSQGLPPSLRLAPTIPLHFHSHLCPHRSQPVRRHHLRHPEPLYLEP